MIGKKRKVLRRKSTYKPEVMGLVVLHKNAFNHLKGRRLFLGLYSFKGLRMLNVQVVKMGD